ncbi:nuclear transport factor 2 [Blastocystis sp. subtype 4]|uniref:nuclear transport factor 2 n=1 Tax=Blastocystis sp. subtype 4 TaxID=944170 RepID=UPI0007122B54|nr:nuclear transport factor 2 [Blastocystis sp. subtype 4]KNB44242.1 nuclear transport factor 2 [Blastocystis sp. subtype 4]|eukprot:XP_014527685.1 nuclear transport factor 2 [Blastocystis sp. subtype 4]
MAQEIGRAFINFFYQCYDTDRTQLQNIYQDCSMLTCEGQEFLGMQNIMGKIAGLGASFGHNIQTMDVQPTPDGSILITCTGEIKIDDNQPMLFTETFIIKDNGGGSFYVHNDMFRFVLA